MDGPRVGTAWIDVDADFSKVNRQVTAFFGRLSKTKKFGLAFGAAAIGAAELGKQLYDVGKEFDAAYDKIRVGTGKTGKQLQGLKRDFKAVVGSTPVDFESAAEAVSELSKRLDLQGKPLRRISKDMLELSRITGSDLKSDIPAITRLFGDWSVKTGQQERYLNKLFRASQKTGIGVTKLAEYMVQFGSPLRQLGFDFDTAAAMFSRFEKEGVNLQTLMPGLRFALKNLANPTSKLAATLKEMGISAKEPNDRLREVIKTIEEAKTVGGATKIASEVFGGRAWSDAAAAIQEGRFHFGALIKEIDSGNDTIRKAGKETMDFAESWDLFKNRLKVAIEPLASKLFQKVGEEMKEIGAILTDPKLTSEEKFSKVFDLIAKTGEEAFVEIADKAGEYAPKAALSFAKGFLNADVWGKLAIAGFLLAKFGGKGAILAAGKQVGELVGIGMAEGEAEGAAAGGAGGAGRMSQVERLGFSGGVGAGAATFPEIAAAGAGAYAAYKVQHHGEKNQAFQEITTGGTGGGFRGTVERSPAGKVVRGAEDAYRALFGTRKIAGHIDTSSLMKPFRESFQRAIAEIEFSVLNKAHFAKQLNRGLHDALAESNKEWEVGTAPWRKHTAAAMQAAVDAIRQGIRTGAVDAQRGQKEISHLLERIHIVKGSDPTGLADGLVKGFKEAHGVTQSGVKELIGDLEQMPKGAREKATDATLQMANAWAKGHPKIEAQVDALRRNLQQKFGRTNHQMLHGTEKLVGGMGNLFGELGEVVGGALEGLGSDVNATLKALGVNKAVHFEVHAAGAAGKAIKGAAEDIGGFVTGKKQGGPLAAIVPGNAPGDRHVLSLNGQPIALVESREGIFVGNRTMMGALGDVNSAIPRRAQGGGVKHPHLSGPEPLRAAGQAGLDQGYKAALAFIAANRPHGGLFAGKTPAGVGSFGGMPVDKWIIPILAWAAKHGWKGSVTSGYRSEAEQAALYANRGSNPNPVAPPGSSNHEKVAYPGGAVDVTLPETLAHVLKRYPRRPNLVWGPEGGNDDPVHFSATGHKLGGLVLQLAKGGHLVGPPLFSGEGPQFYDAAFKHNKEWAKPGPWQSALNAPEEADFRAWVKKHRVPFNPDAQVVDYDMRGFWKATGGAWKGGHFPDTWKTPFDTAFSNESRYAKKGTPFVYTPDFHWLYDRRNGQKIVNTWKYAQGGAVVRLAGEILDRHGLDLFSSAGVMGNSWQESGWDTEAMEPGTHNGGLFGFTTGEKSLSALESFASRQGKSWKDTTTQVQFMLTTLPDNVKSAMNAMASLEDTTAYFMNNWEHPDPSAANLPRRIEGAKHALQILEGANIGTASGAGGKAGTVPQQVTGKYTGYDYGVVGHGKHPAELVGTASKKHYKVQTDQLSFGSLPSTLQACTKELRERQRQLAEYNAAIRDEKNAKTKQALEANANLLRNRIAALRKQRLRLLRELANKKALAKIANSALFSKFTDPNTGIFARRQSDYEFAQEGAEQSISLEPDVPRGGATASWIETVLRPYVEGTESGAFQGVLGTEGSWRNAIISAEHFAENRIEEWRVQAEKLQYEIDYIESLRRSDPKAYAKRKGQIPGDKQQIKALRANIKQTRTVTLPEWDSSLDEVQGRRRTHELLASLPSDPTGQFGGSIFDTQLSIKELGLKVSEALAGVGEGEGSDRTALLEELLRQANQRNIARGIEEHVYGSAQMGGLQQGGMVELPPYAGKAHWGAIVPGPSTDERTMVVKGGEGIFTEEQMAALGGAGAPVIEEMHVYPDGRTKMRIGGKEFEDAVRRVVRHDERQGARGVRRGLSRAGV